MKAMQVIQVHTSDASHKDESEHEMQRKIQLHTDTGCILVYSTLNMTFHRV